MHKLLMAALILLLSSNPCFAQESGSFMERIIKACLAEIGSTDANGLQDCLEKNGLNGDSAAPAAPAVVQMGTTRRGLEPPAIVKYGAGVNPKQNITAKPADDSFTGGVADPGSTAQTPGQQASEKAPSTTKRYYLQSGQSGTGAKPIFLNR